MRLIASSLTILIGTATLFGAVTPQQTPGPAPTGIAEVTRALDAYEAALRTGRQKPDALAAIAEDAARFLTRSEEPLVALVACGIKLRRDGSDTACAGVVRAATSEALGRDTQAINAYLLANVGYRPFPALLELGDDISARARLAIAARSTRLPDAERVRVLEGILDREAFQRSWHEALSGLADIGPAALGALARPTPQLSLRLSVQMARARLGDKAAVSFVEEMRSSVMGPQSRDLALALVVGGSRYGPDPARLIEITPAIEQPRIALGLARVNAPLAEATIRTLLGDDSPLVRARALEAAGVLGLGTDAVVYRRMADTDAAVRLAAVNAVLQTLDTRSAAPTQR
jgi:hypothetical protein